MKVIPKKKQTLNHDELRVININRDAVEELLWENLMDHIADYFDILDDQTICLMQWDSESDMLTYIILPDDYANIVEHFDYSLIRQKAGITTTSLYRQKKYRTFRISDDLFGGRGKKPRDKGDGFA